MTKLAAYKYRLYLNKIFSYVRYFLNSQNVIAIDRFFTSSKIYKCSYKYSDLKFSDRILEYTKCIK
jgi:hypothetical protein